MAPLQPQPATTPKKNRTLKTGLRIDMTPMVDLGFLLITFFIFTSTMAEKRSTDLIMPKDGSPMSLANSAALTVLLTGGDSVFLYNGAWKEAFAKKEIIITNYSTTNGLGNYIREKQKTLGQKRDELMLLIKPTANSTYNNLINALDEVLINEVHKYAIVDITGEEQAFMADRSAKKNL